MKKSEEKSQHERFIEATRQLECDEDKEWFEAKLKRIATAKEKKVPAKPKQQEC
jgi:hypothetical protein